MRLFGTNGIREIVGTTLTPPFALRVARAIAASIPAGPPVAVAWDGRTSSVALARLVGATLALSGHRVIELGLLPTPAFQYNIPRLGAQLGVMITASHNPREFNGIKCIAADGLEIPRSWEETIEKYATNPPASSPDFQGIGSLYATDEAATRYVDAIVALVDADRIRRRNFTVVLDCGNGASVPTSPALLRRLGCRVVTLNGHIDGTFPGHLSEPTEANVGDLLKTVKALGADLGIVHDGDADRAIFVDGEGRYIPGEASLTLLAHDRVAQHGGGIVVTPVTASQSVEDAIRPLGGEVIYTRVGSPTVTHEMQARQAIFGGEENGGLIFPEFQLARDGAMSAAAMLELLARRELTLAAALREIPRYTLLKEKLPCPSAIHGEVLERLAAELTEASERVLTLDGVKAFRDGGWLLVRPSGTEPLLRIFAEAREPARAEALARFGMELSRRIVADLSGSAKR
jgi:phosphomannomutase/phosphoglucomutase